MSVATDTLAGMRDALEGPKREDESQTAFAIRIVQLETVQAAMLEVLRAELAEPVKVPSPQPPDPRCSETLRLQGKAYPRTCMVHGLGPCR